MDTKETTKDKRGYKTKVTKYSNISNESQKNNLIRSLQKMIQTTVPKTNLL